MSCVVLDDHLLRDVLSGDVGTGLARVLRANEPATTNLYYFRLCRSAVAARGGALTGRWPQSQRQQLARSLTEISEEIAVVPLRTIAFRMAELAAEHRVSTLGAEAVAAAEHLGGRLCVWAGDDGPAIRTCAAAVRVRYQTFAR